MRTRKVTNALDGDDVGRVTQVTASRADPMRVDRHDSRPRLGFWSHPLFRQRPHRLVDLLLGAFALACLAGGLAAISPILALVVVIATVGLYLDTLRREERARKQRSSSRKG